MKPACRLIFLPLISTHKQKYNIPVNKSKFPEHQVMIAIAVQMKPGKYRSESCSRIVKIEKL